MATNGIDYMRRVLSGTPTWLLAVAVVLPTLGAVLGWVTGNMVDAANIRSVLSTLAVAQASVLAIVFSVTVIGIQLVATRYSPRLMPLFTDAPILVFTFVVFILSIAVDIGLLYTVPPTESRLFVAGVYAAMALGGVTALSLFVFIRVAIQQSTPEGVITAFIEDRTADKYLAQVTQSVEDDLQNVHPLHPLYSMVMEAVSNRNRATAELALRNYGIHATNLLDIFKERDAFADLDHKVSRALFKPVLEEHLHDIALHAEEQDESQLVGDATNWMHEIGVEGLEITDPTVSRQAVRGLSNVIRHAPIDDGQYRSNDVAWRTLGAFMEDATEYPQPRVVQDAASTVASCPLWLKRPVADT